MKYNIFLPRPPFFGSYSRLLNGFSSLMAQTMWTHARMYLLGVYLMLHSTYG